MLKLGVFQSESPTQSKTIGNKEVCMEVVSFIIPMDAQVRSPRTKQRSRLKKSNIK